MVNILIAYSSKTGNTEKLAQAVAEGAKEAGANCVLKEAKKTTVEDLVSADGIIVGSPVYFGSMSAEVKELFDRSLPARGRLKNKVGAAFTTAGHPTGGKETTILSILQAMLIHEMIVVGDPISVGGHYGVGCVGAPNEKVENAAKALAKKVVEVATKLK
jgi:NAD(P)H dehydrogenase (quinone)